VNIADCPKKSTAKGTLGGVLSAILVLFGQSIVMGQEQTSKSPSAETKQVAKKQYQTRKSGVKTSRKSAGKFDGINSDSFRIFVPSLGQSKLEGIDDYSYRLTVPSDTYLEASLESGRGILSPEQYREIAREKWGEGEKLRAAGTTKAMRDAMGKYEEALRYFRAAGRMSEPSELARALTQIGAIADSSVTGNRRSVITSNLSLSGGRPVSAATNRRRSRKSVGYIMHWVISSRRRNLSIRRV